MAISLQNITRGKTIKAPRILLPGREKVGKSTFAAGFPAPIFIPIKGETGIDDLDVAKFPPAKTYAEVIECIGTLYGESHEYQTVVIDSTSTLEPLIWDAVCKEHGAASIETVLKGFGKGYIEALKYWRELCDGLDALRDEKNMGCILIQHTKVKVFNDPVADAYDQYVVDLQDRAAQLLIRWADCVLFPNFKSYTKSVALGVTGGPNEKKATHAVGNAERVLHTQWRPAHPGGGRGVYGRLPYELKLEYPAFAAAVEKANQPKE